MKNFLSVAVVFFLGPFLLAGWSGCNDRLLPVGPGSDEGVILPLKTGNSWTYRSDYPGDELKTWQVDSLGAIGSHTWFFSTWHREGDRSQSGPILRNVEGSAVFFTPSHYDSVSLQLTYPGNVGDIFEPDTLRDPLRITAWTIASTDTVITVPAGTFRCYLYRRKQIEPPLPADSPLPVYIDTHLFVCPNVGIIRYDDYHYGYVPGTTSNLRRTELVDYSLQ